jgi:hypothetical protein
VLRAQGLGVKHIRETDAPGAFDLLCSYEAWNNGRMSVPYFWVELKIMDEPLRPSQITFQRDNGTEVMFVMRLREGAAVQILNRDSAVELAWVSDFRKHAWKPFFVARVEYEFNR